MRSPLVQALLNPINLAMLALAIAAGLCSAWWLFPLGLFLWIIMALLVARDPALRLKQQMAARQPLAQRFQQHYNRLERMQLSLFRTITDLQGRQRQQLHPILQELSALVNEAYRFSEQMTLLENHRLVTQRWGNLHDQISDMQFRFDQEKNPDIRKEYEESLQSLQERYTSLLSLSKLLERAEAQLATLTSELARVQTQVIRIQTLDPERMAVEIQTIVLLLTREKEELILFDQEQ